MKLITRIACHKLRWYQQQELSLSTNIRTVTSNMKPTDVTFLHSNHSKINLPHHQIHCVELQNNLSPQQHLCQQFLKTQNNTFINSSWKHKPLSTVPENRNLYQQFLKTQNNIVVFKVEYFVHWLKFGNVINPAACCNENIIDLFLTKQQ